MKKLTLISLVGILFTGCTPTYEHTLILDNNSSWDLEVFMVSSNPEFVDTVTVSFGSEAVLFHSESKDYEGLSCLGHIDSIIVEPIFRDFNGMIMNPDSWVTERVDRPYKKLTFCTYVFSNDQFD